MRNAVPTSLKRPMNPGRLPSVCGNCMADLRKMGSPIVQSCILIWYPKSGRAMPARTIILKLNQQQLELIDRTIAQGAAPDRVALVQRAIREQSEKHAK